MRFRCLLVLGLVACGRVSFDPLVGAAIGDAAVDAAPLALPSFQRGSVFPASAASPEFLVEGLATDPAGNIYVAGAFSGQAMLGPAPLTASTAEAAFLASYDRELAPRWATGFTGTAGTSLGQQVVVAGDAVHLSGLFEATFELGGAALLSAGGDDRFAARFTLAGAHAWSSSWGSTGDDDGGGGLAIASDGTQVLGAACVGPFSFGGPVLDGSTRDPCLGVVDPAGGHLASARWPGGGTSGVLAVAHAPDGDLVIAGYFTQLAIGGRLLSSRGAVDTFVARLAPDLAVRWVLDFGGALTDEPHDLVVGADGTIYVAGLGGSMMFGTTAIASHDDGYDGWLARIDGDGTPRWMRPIGGAGFDTLHSVVLRGGLVYVAGAFETTLDLDGHGAVSAGGYDAMVVGLEPADGQVRWLATAGGATDEGGERLAVAGTELILAGYARGPVDLGDGLRAVGEGALFLVRYGP